HRQVPPHDDAPRSRRQLEVDEPRLARDAARELHAADRACPFEALAASGAPLERREVELVLARPAHRATFACPMSIRSGTGKAGTSATCEPPSSLRLMRGNRSSAVLRLVPRIAAVHEELDVAQAFGGSVRPFGPALEDVLGAVHAVERPSL